jgi:hypothetical protein
MRFLSGQIGHKLTRDRGNPVDAARACIALELAARSGESETIWPLMVTVIEETLAAIEEAKTLL